MKISAARLQERTNRVRAPGWRQVGEAIDALMKCARETPEGARQVRAVMLFGKPTSEQIAEVDRMLAAEGINVPASVT